MKTFLYCIIFFVFVLFCINIAHASSVINYTKNGVEYKLTSGGSLYIEDFQGKEMVRVIYQQYTRNLTIERSDGGEFDFTNDFGRFIWTDFNGDLNYSARISMVINKDGINSGYDFASQQSGISVPSYSDIDKISISSGFVFAPYRSMWFDTSTLTSKNSSSSVPSPGTLILMMICWPILILYVVRQLDKKD